MGAGYDINIIDHFVREPSSAWEKGFFPFFDDDKIDPYYPAATDSLLEWRTSRGYTLGNAVTDIKRIFIVAIGVLFALVVTFDIFYSDVPDPVLSTISYFGEASLPPVTESAFWKQTFLSLKGVFVTALSVLSQWESVPNSIYDIAIKYSPSVLYMIYCYLVPIAYLMVLSKTENNSMGRVHFWSMSIPFPVFWKRIVSVSLLTAGGYFILKFILTDLVAYLSELHQNISALQSFFFSV